MRSYAQNGEDVRLQRVFSHLSDGFFIDVGACHPVNHNVTKHFSEQGWRGINIEPNPTIFSELERDRPREINLNVGIGDRVDRLVFFECVEQIGSSTFSRDEASKLAEAGSTLNVHEVELTTLDLVCRAHAPEVIHFLKIDVEGGERAVLEGMDWSRYRPIVVVIEATLPNSPRPCHELWEELLLRADYRFACFDGLNRFYVRREDEGLIPTLALCPNVFDEFVNHETMERIEQLQMQLEQQADLIRRLESDLSRIRLDAAHRTNLEAVSLGIARRIAHRSPRLTEQVARWLRGVHRRRLQLSTPLAFSAGHAKDDEESRFAGR